MTHHLQILQRHIVAIIFIALIGAPMYALGDDINPQIANCQEITDPDTQTQVDLCTAHVGCKLVMGLQKACTKVKTFLTSLKNLSFGKNKIDSNDVFDAAAPSAEGDVSFNTISNSIKSNYDKQPKKQVVSGEFENGSKWVYEGPMTKGVRNGTGVLITDSGTVFRGDFVEGRQAGMGELFNDKTRKAGVMVGAKMDGFGIERDADGVRYEGEHKADKYNGNGVMTWPSGNRHEGTYKDGARNGQGTLKWANGNQYTGEFLNNKISGQGTFKFTNGNQYTGNFVNSKMSGQGTYTWADGDRFEGEWRDDKKLNGTQINTNGSRINIANGAVVESPQQVTERVTKNYDQKIAAAQEQCNSRKDSCDTKCAALSALSIFGGTSNVSEHLECTNGCDNDKSSCEQQVSALEQEKSQAITGALASKAPNGSGNGTTAANTGLSGTSTNRRNLPFEECQSQEKSSNIPSKLDALPKDNTNLLTRGAIVAIDVIIKTYSQCLPDQRAQEIITQYKKTREDTLRTCRQISSSDNCLVSPF